MRRWRYRMTPSWTWFTLIVDRLSKMSSSPNLKVLERGTTQCDPGYRSLFQPPNTGLGSVPDPLIHAGDEFDERLVQVPAHCAGNPGAEGFRRPFQDVRLPRVQRRLQGAGETAHAVDVSEKLLVCHVGVLRHFSCRLLTLIKLSQT
jgi:hypothetical protein